MRREDLRRAGIRRRITVIASAAVAVVLTAAGLGLVIQQRVALTDGIDRSLRQRADAIEDLITAGGVPMELPTGGTEEFAQVVGDDGRALVTTPNLAGSGPMPMPPAPAVGDGFVTLDGLAIDDDTFRILLRRIDAGLLAVGITADTMNESTGALFSGLALGVPIVTAILGVLVWWLVGRTLGPVESIRAEVAAIKAGVSGGRVSPPGTGDEIDKLAETMNEMLDRLEDAATRQRRFVADASHELRSPLARLRSRLEVDRGEPAVSDAERARIDHTLTEVHDLQRITEDLLHLARSAEGRLDPALEPVDLDDLVLRETQRARFDGGVELDASGVSAAQVLGDRRLLGLAIRNLLDNATRHATSRVTVTLGEWDAHAVFVVADDGPGIPADDAHLVFEPFVTGDAARTPGAGGSGLGLSIAREIVMAHSGSLALVGDGATGAGAIFELRLPSAR